MTDGFFGGVPAGFVRHDRQSGLTAPWEPLYSRRGDDGVTRIGFAARDAHCNSRGFVHGGLVTALSDNAMGESCARVAGVDGLVTVSLSVDFLASARRGDWVEVRPQVLRAGRRICFVEARVIARTASAMAADAHLSVRDGELSSAGERIIARASAAFAVSAGGLSSPSR